MSDQLPEPDTNPPQGSSCSTHGQGCPACGGGKALLLGMLILAGLYFVINRQGSAGTAAGSASAVPWVEDYDAGLAMAAQKNEPVLLAFKATWCGPCREMDREVFSKPGAAKMLADWIPVHLDFDKNRELANKYGLRGVPTFIVLAPSGKEVDRIDGGLTMQEFASFLASAEAKLPKPAQAGS